MAPEDHEELGRKALDEVRSLGDDASLDTLNEKRRATLAEIDKASFSYAFDLCVTKMLLISMTPSWFHVRVSLVAGAGFFTDA